MWHVKWRVGSRVLALPPVVVPLSVSVVPPELNEVYFVASRVFVVSFYIDNAAIGIEVDTHMPQWRGVGRPGRQWFDRQTRRVYPRSGAAMAVDLPLAMHVPTLEFGEAATFVLVGAPRKGSQPHRIRGREAPYPGLELSGNKMIQSAVGIVPLSAEAVAVRQGFRD